MNDEERAHQILIDIPAVVDAGEYDMAMELLAEVDQLDGSRAKETTNLRHAIAARRAELSAGTSFSTSESKPEQSGSSTGTDLLSPAQDVENLSEQDPQAKQTSSTVTSTDGSIPETGSGPASQPDSSEESPPAAQATQAPPSSPKSSKARVQRGGAS